MVVDHTMGPGDPVRPLASVLLYVEISTPTLRPDERELDTSTFKVYMMGSMIVAHCLYVC